MTTHPLQQVLQHLHAGRWNAAHDLVQHDGSMLAAWLHGILHVQEGDLEDAQSLLPVSQGSRSGLCGMGCKARCAANSSAIGNRRNAADRPQRPLPEGLERNRAIERLGCFHGHEPMLRIRSIHSSRLRSNATPARPEAGSANWYDRAARHFRSRGSLAEEIAAFEAALAASETSDPQERT
ncbi:MAG: hypothetical protein ACK4OE_04960 [Acidovorax sp.]|uniref:hypothetical protein n=1 Tax=Acidovorax sp. TaxID=1872122 RepID=UPI00391871B2